MKGFAATRVCPCRGCEISFSLSRPCRFPRLDPSLLVTNLPAEYGLASAAFDWSDEIVGDMARTSMDTSFAKDDVKARLKSKLSNWQS